MTSKWFRPEQMLSADDLPYLFRQHDPEAEARQRQHPGSCLTSGGTYLGVVATAISRAENYSSGSSRASPVTKTVSRGGCWPTSARSRTSGLKRSTCASPDLCGYKWDETEARTWSMSLIRPVSSMNH